MQAISSTSLSTSVELGFTLSPTPQKEVGSASNVTCYVTEGKSVNLFDEQDYDSDIVSITATDSADEFYACSTAEANIFFSKLLEECDSTLISVLGSGPVEPSVSGSNACDEFKTASANIINAHIIEPQGSNNKRLEVVIDSLCEVDDESVFQGICCAVSPNASFYTESDEPRTSCPSSMSSIVVPVPMPAVISFPSDKSSTENVQQSFSYLDFSSAVSETKAHRRGKQFWNHICLWFYGKGDARISTSADKYAEEQSITSSHDPDSTTLADSALTSSDSVSGDISVSCSPSAASSITLLPLSKPVSSKVCSYRTVYAPKLASTNDCELLCKQAHGKCQADKLRQRVSRGWKAIKSSWTLHK
ncbi:unnamed protein product [Ambrosiozyma monospora]|uniref:Unnamed protein product n=1 Tax=Ambrosiozyma monospora TaxID=43982 RepID=A0A9W6YZR2_AMBMO|nr:unnamed protein product [Ambrosiozyma monospora]